MKNKIILLFIISIVFISSTNAIPQEYITDGYTVALYHFNEGSGNIAYDEMNNYDGSLMNGANYNINTPFSSGYSLDLDGIDDYVSINPNMLNNLPQGTFEADIYVRNPISPAGFIIVGKGATNFLIQVLCDGYLSTHMGGYLYFSSNNPITFNKWNHIALTWNGSSWKYYINGVFDNEVVTSTIPGSNPITEVKIGNHVDTYHADGLIDEVRISNIAREFDHAPIINSYTPYNLDFIMDEGQSQIFKVNASDSDGDILSYEWYLNDELVSIVRNYTFSPDYTQEGNYNLRIEISDGILITNMEWDITVNNKIIYKGDANCDGVVDPLDLTIIKRIVANIPVTECCIENCMNLDFDNDQVLSSLDMLGVKLILIGQKNLEVYL